VGRKPALKDLPEPIEGRVNAPARRDATSEHTKEPRGMPPTHLPANGLNRRLWVAGLRLTGFPEAALLKPSPQRSGRRPTKGRSDGRGWAPDPHLKLRIDNDHIGAVGPPRALQPLAHVSLDGRHRIGAPTPLFVEDDERVLVTTGQRPEVLVRPREAPRVSLVVSEDIEGDKTDAEGAMPPQQRGEPLPHVGIGNEEREISRGSPPCGQPNTPPAR